MSGVEFETGLPGERLAYFGDGSSGGPGACGFFWLGGFMSDMTGSKAVALSELAHAKRRSCLRFDYSGHGRSGGAFTDGTISKWLEQSTHMFLTHASGQRIVVGSSMGGWLALLLARKLQREDQTAFRRIAGLVLLAPAVDMTRALMWDQFTNLQQQELKKTGCIDIPSHYGNPYPVTAELVTDGERHLLLDKSCAMPMPVRILQGNEDIEVPLSHAGKVLQMIEGDDVTMTIVKNGDHRLSKLPQLRLLQDTVLRLAERADRIDY